MNFTHIVYLCLRNLVYTGFSCRIMLLHTPPPRPAHFWKKGASRFWSGPATLETLTPLSTSGVGSIFDCHAFCPATRRSSGNLSNVSVDASQLSWSGASSTPCRAGSLGHSCWRRNYGLLTLLLSNSLTDKICQLYKILIKFYWSIMFLYNKYYKFLLKIFY